MVDCVATHNVIVDSVAGSGKTTTILQIAEAYPTKRVLIMTYNTHLRYETIGKSNRRGLTNVDIHTYHSFVSQYLTEGLCQNDEKLLAALKRPRVQREYRYDIIVLDETQDMVQLLYDTTQVLFRYNAVSHPHICVFGDVRQSIYQYKGSDPEYITKADTRFAVNSRWPWKRMHLTRTFRLSRSMCDFVNESMLGERRLWSAKQGPQPRYLIMNVYCSDVIVDMIDDYKRKGYKDDDLFIIAPSVLSIEQRYRKKGSKERPGNSPINAVENLLKKRQYNVFVKTKDDGCISEEVIRNKLVITTLHGSKGLERPIVIVMGFDGSYFKYFARDEHPNQCPNVLYVAATRATRELVMIHSEKEPFLPFLNCSALDKTAYVEDARKDQSLPWMPPQFERNCQPFIAETVTALLDHTSFQVLQNALSFLDIVCIREDTSQRLSISTDVKSTVKDSKELVSDITGVAIPDHYRRRFSRYHSIADEYTAFIKTLRRTTSQLARNNGFIYKKRQIQHYNWVTMEEFRVAMSRMDSLNLIQDTYTTPKENSDSSESDASDSCFEKVCRCRALNDVLFSGRVDYMDEHKVIEFKCTTNLTSDSFVQLALYAYILSQNSIKDEQHDLSHVYYIYNIFTDEMYTIRPKTSSSLRDMYRSLVEAHH